MLLGADFKLIDRLPHLSLPKLIIHGDKDDIIPLELGRQVFEAAKPPKSFYIIPGADHNNTYQVGGDLFRTIRRVCSDRHPILAGCWRMGASAREVWNG